MNIATHDLGRTARRIQDGLEFVHDDPLDVDFFRELGSVQKEAMYDREGRLKDITHSKTATRRSSCSLRQLRKPTSLSTTRWRFGSKPIDIG